MRFRRLSGNWTDKRGILYPLVARKECSDGAWPCIWGIERGYVRLSYATAMDQIKIALDQIGGVCPFDIIVRGIVWRRLS